MQLFETESHFDFCMTGKLAGGLLDALLSAYRVYQFQFYCGEKV
jgi:hypothetical protein